MIYNPKVEVLHATVSPEVIVANVATQTMHQDLQLVKKPDALCERLYKAKHLSVFEHAFLSLRLTNVSRSFMAQITKHRHLSITSSSQHYQDYSNYEFCGWHYCEEACQDALKHYKKLLEQGVPVHEARQVLPNAMAVNMVISGNAHAWMDMLPKRLCHRNVNEMVMATREIHKVLVNWFNVFKFVGPSCEEIGICFEGKMSCGRVRDIR